jgi:hypothetical protein
LEKLAPTINAFKSEAVQLRIVELVFSGSIAPTVADKTFTEEAVVTAAPKRRRRKKQALTTNSSELNEESKKPRTGRKSNGRPGPGAMIDTLISEGYFVTGRGPGDIVAHCRDNKVQTYSNTEISVSLARAVKASKLKRTKNSDGQFRYTAA